MNSERYHFEDELREAGLLAQGESIYDADGELRERQMVFPTEATVPDADSVAPFLARGLNPALETFHPQVLPVGPEASGPSFEKASLYAACAFQLFNAIARRAAYDTCAYGPCGNVFEKGSGRASNKAYCSRSCKSKQGMRDWRAALKST